MILGVGLGEVVVWGGGLLLEGEERGDVDGDWD